jgi:hypothetical protein
VREVHEALAKDTGYTSTLKQMQVMRASAEDLDDIRRMFDRFEKKRKPR